MKKITLLILLCISLTNLQGQDIFEKISKQICKCIEKKDTSISLDRSLKLCTEESMINNLKELKEYYHVESMAELDTKDLGYKIAIKLLKNCDASYKLFNQDSLSKEQEKKKYTTDYSLNCEKIRTGKYYYLTPNPSKKFDTVRVIIDTKNYLEIIGPEKSYSKLSIKWIDNCKFRLTFIESNNQLKKTLSNKGDKYDYEIVQNLPDMLILKASFHGIEYFFEYFKE